MVGITNTKIHEIYNNSQPHRHFDKRTKLLLHHYKVLKSQESTRIKHQLMQIKGTKKIK